jgi:hypothetical protein
MSGESIREMLKAQPFKPFEVHMSSGDVYLVDHPEHGWVAGAAFYVWLANQPGDRVARCSLLHVTDVEYSEGQAKKKGGKS